MYLYNKETTRRTIKKTTARRRHAQNNNQFETKLNINKEVIGPKRHHRARLFLNTGQPPVASSKSLMLFCLQLHPHLHLLLHILLDSIRSEAHAPTCERLAHKNTKNLELLNIGLVDSHFTTCQGLSLSFFFCFYSARMTNHQVQHNIFHFFLS